MDKKEIFIIGAPRSGTTWLLRLLASHSNVVMANTIALHLKEGIGSPHSEESHYFNFRIENELKFDTEEDFINQTRKRYYSILSDDKFCFLDKTPDHVFHLDKIKKCFPNAYIIHIIRDGHDVLASLKDYKYLKIKKYAPFGTERPDNFRGNDYYQVSKLENNELNIWKDFVEAGIEGSKIFQNYTEIFYEDLISNTETVLSALFSHIGLDDESNSIIQKYNKDSSSVLGESSKICVVGGVNRWGRILTQEEVNKFRHNSLHLLRKYRYYGK
jgi:hypothetical protein